VTIRTRGLGTDDIPAWRTLLAAAEQVDQTGEHYDEADLAEELANPDIEPGKDIVGAFDASDLVGVVTVVPRSSSEVGRLLTSGVTRPDRRGQGVGTLLMTAMFARAREHQQSFGDVMRVEVTGLSDDQAQARLLADFDILPERYTFTMHTDLTEVADPPSLAEGFALREYDDSLSAAMLRSHNIAFLDHRGFTTWSETAWEQWVTGSRSFRPELTFVVTPADDPGSVAAYLQSAEFEAHHAVTGRREAYVGKLGTLPAYRGHGLASFLLGHALVAYQSAGYDESTLDVDSENPTGALGIYQRAGFIVQRRWTNYTGVVAPSRPTPGCGRVAW
jgi:mycothiol synthase